MKKNPFRPSRDEIKRQQPSVANLGFYRQIKRILDAPRPPAMTSAQADLLRMAENYAAKHIPQDLLNLAEELYTATFQRVQEECETAIEHGQYEPFWRNLALFGPRLLVEATAVAAIMEEWWLAAKKGDQSAKENLHAALDALHVGSGRYETLTEEEREAIVADCKKWRPICEGLNETFKKKLWKQSEYESSDLYRKEARGSLAEK